MLVLLITTSVLITAFWGWRAGALRVILKLVVLALAYALTWQEVDTLARYLTEKHWLPGVLVWPAAAATLFIGGSIVFNLCAAGLVYIAPKEWDRSSKKFGAVIGGLLGGIISVFLVWTIGVVQESLAKRQLTQSEKPDIQTDSPVPTSRSATDQLVHDFATSAISSAATSLMGDSPTASLAGEIARSPISVGEGFKYMAEHPDLRLLLQDTESYATLTRGSPDAVLQLPHFRALVADPELMRFLGTTGLAGETPAEQELDLATKLSTYAHNFETLRHTPEYQALAADPDFQSQLKSGQWLQLLTNEKARELAEILVNPETPTQQYSAQETSTGFTLSAPGQTKWNSTPEQPTSTDYASPADAGPATPKIIYRWRDPDGHMHLTDEKPAEGTLYDTLVQ